jgi:peptidoglycan hydrolase-like protein with peptidoglycan-binding domain
MHVSVGSSKALYDDERTWVLPSGKEIQGGTEPEEGADLPSIRMVLRRGSSGDEVRIVQRLLMVNVDGMFGPATEQAVKGLQRGADLTPDGIVGSLTWAELDKLEQQPAGNWQTNITATVFGGKKDPNKSAYSNRMISDTELSGALPYRFPGARPPVEVAYPVTGKTVIISLEDVGPWNINDPYWETNSRPQAESGWDTRKRKTNLAGIDLTPAAAKALGLKGLGKVNWRFVTEIDDGEPTA